MRKRIMQVGTGGPSISRACTIFSVLAAEKKRKIKKKRFNPREFLAFKKSRAGELAAVPLTIDYKKDFAS